MEKCFICSKSCNMFWLAQICLTRSTPFYGILYNLPEKLPSWSLDCLKGNIANLLDRWTAWKGILQICLKTSWFWSASRYTRTYLCGVCPWILCLWVEVFWNLEDWCGHRYCKADIDLLKLFWNWMIMNLKVLWIPLDAIDPPGATYLMPLLYA